jgi:hypothetical protein
MSPSRSTRNHSMLLYGHIGPRRFSMYPSVTPSLSLSMYNLPLGTHKQTYLQDQEPDLEDQEPDLN